MPAKKVKIKKKAAVKKKAAPKKKAAVKKKAAPKKKAAVKKKAAPKKKAAVKKKAAPKKKAASKTKAEVEKKPTKSELAQQKALAEREKKKAKRIELLNKRSPVELPVEGIVPYTLHRGESYMSDSQLEHFRNILLRWKQDLIDEVKRTVDQMKNDAGQFADPADRATQEEEFSLELRTRDRESKLIRKINQTLATIDSEDYGYCESCGIEIGIKRLEARPTATLCIDCKTLQEIKEKQIFT
jgi:DnaK suppressor protein